MEDKITKGFQKKFKAGKQGIAGISVIENNGQTKKIVFKISQGVNYLAEHEFTVMTDLSKTSCSHHFLKPIGLLEMDVNIEKDIYLNRSFEESESNQEKRESRLRKAVRTENPFINRGKMTKKSVLLMEMVENSIKLESYIKQNLPKEIIFSAIKQVLAALHFAQKQCQFSHYDLHSANILMKRCSRDMVFLYVFNENQVIAVPTHGSFPVIIDYGFSFSKSVEKGPLYPSLAFTDTGFFSDRFDSFADMRLFLVSVLCEMEKYDVPKFKKLVKNNYKKTKVDWLSGWDEGVKYCATDKVIQKIRKIKNATIFGKEKYASMDILQTMIIGKLEKKDTKFLKISYDSFTREFAKIEKFVRNSNMCLLILQNIIENARKVRLEYESGNTLTSVGEFRRNVCEFIDSNIKFGNIRDIDWEIFLCSLLSLSNNMNGVLYRHMKKREKEKKKLYETIKIKKCSEMVVKLSKVSDYIYSQKTNVMVITNEKSFFMEKELDLDIIEKLNTCRDGRKIGNILLNYIQNSNGQRSPYFTQGPQVSPALEVPQV